MRFLLFLLPILAFAQAPVIEAQAAASETLRYAVNWPSGLSLGEASFSASKGLAGLEFSFAIDASIPGFAVEERATSKATLNFCSTEFEKIYTRGTRKANETLTFDASKSTATRTTKNGGTSEIPVPQCAKDALAFLHFLRKELAAGRLPAQQKVFYGAGYDTRVQFIGIEKVVLGGEQVEAEKVLITIKGPASENSAEVLFAKDAVRTPLAVRVPFAMGKFSMEILR